MPNRKFIKAQKSSNDAHGNTTSMPHLSSMLWDYKDELTEVDLGGGGTAYYNYDSSGNRTRKVIEKTGGIIETRYYLGDYELYKRTVSGATDYQRQTTTLSDGEKVFARIEQLDSQPPVVRYQFDNHLGSASLELDTASAIISYEEYHPFGSTSYRSGKTETEVSLKRYKYNGKEKDDETGLYYYGARYYAAWLGRFVSVDPLAHQTPSWNAYHYCHGNPVNLVDPSGMKAEEPDVPPVLPDKSNIETTRMEGNVKFFNIEAAYSAKAYQKLEKFYNENKLGEVSDLDEVDGKVKRDYNKLLNDYKSKLNKAVEIDKAITEVVAWAKEGFSNTDVLKNNAPEIKNKDIIKPFEDLSMNKDEFNNSIFTIQISIDETPTGAGMNNALGATVVYKDSTTNKFSGAKIKLDSTTMDMSATLADEIGDVYFKVLAPESEKIDNKDINEVYTAPNAHQMDVNSRHDANLLLYKNNALKSKRFSAEFRWIFKEMKRK